MNRKSFAITLALSGLLPCTALRAETADVPNTGVFAGRIGTARVQVCFSSYGSGHYYYLRHRAGIRLEPAVLPENIEASEWMRNEVARGKLELIEASGSFASASPPTGIWHLQFEADGWHGQWRDPADTRQLPIRLTRIQGTTTSDPSTGDCPPEFYAPLRDDLQITRTEAEFEGHRYLTLSTTAATAMALPDTASAAKAVNAYATHWLKDQAVFGYECSLGNGGGSPTLDRTLAPIVWSDRYLVLQDNLPDTYCGGAHGFFEQNYVVWDLETGKMIDTWSWFDHASIDVTQTDDGEPVRSALRQLLHDHYPRVGPDEECREYLDMMSIAPPYPTANGLVFPTSFFHAMRACGDDITLTWVQAAPHLSDAGKLAMKAWVQ